MRKMELEGAVRRADDRNWTRVFATLQGTALMFHKYKSSGVFGTRPEFLDDCPDLPVEAKKGEFLCSYNLHLADAGIAADYTKFVSRPIMETLADRFEQENSCNQDTGRIRPIYPLLPTDRDLCPLASCALHGHRFGSSTG